MKYLKNSELNKRNDTDNVKTLIRAPIVEKRRTEFL